MEMITEVECVVCRDKFMPNFRTLEAKPICGLKCRKIQAKLLKIEKEGADNG
jgi:hypothetical protein